MLHGRSAEGALLAGLLADARAGRARAVALVGDAGIGKTALLDHVAQLATDLTVFRAVGVPAETGLPYAGLHALLRPVSDRIDVLPPAQADALAGALGLRDVQGQNRFVVAAAVVALLAHLAEERPVLCLVDDAQWLDESSFDALSFAARRFDADRIAMVFAVRGDTREIAAVEEYRLGPLAAEDSAALVAERAGRLATAGGGVSAGGGGPIDALMLRRIVEAAQGNPLALAELTSEVLAQGDPGPDPVGELPLSSRLRRAFVRRLEELPPDARRLLHLAAAEGTGDLELVLRAADSSGIDGAALARAERSGLVRVEDGRLLFAHPLMRAAVHQSAPFATRRTAHRLLAAALTSPADADRRTWHRAAAAVPPDEPIAAELVAVARAARQCGAQDVAEAALERAAALTGDPARGAALLLEAAESAWYAGRPRRARRLAGRVLQLAVEPTVRARADQLRGRLEARRGRTLEGYELLVDAADRLAATDPQRAATALVDALQAASYAGDVARVVEAGRRAAALPPPAGSSLAVALASGVASLLGGDVVRGTEVLSGAVEQAGDLDDPVLLTWAGTAAMYLADEAAGERFGVRAAARARTSGAWGELTRALELLAVSELASHPLAAEADAAEGLRLAEEIDQPMSAVMHLGLLAMVAAVRGDEVATWRHVERIGQLGGHRNLALAEGWGVLALGWLDLGLGRPDACLTRLVRFAGGGGHPAVVLASLPDVVESAVRVGAQAQARLALDRFEPWARSAGTSRATAVLARCRALVLDGEAAEAEFERAVALHAPSGPTLDAARTALVYGEHLRRGRRRVEARPHLALALETFERLGARPWAERAARELRASGGPQPRRDAVRPGAPELTAQERQIVSHVNRGLTNKEIAANLFISPRTVDHHLRNAFAKLGVTSRAQLREHLLP